MQVLKWSENIDTHGKLMSTCPNVEAVRADIEAVLPDVRMIMRSVFHLLRTLPYL